jgi:hypothetical protein
VEVRPVRALIELEPFLGYSLTGMFALKTTSRERSPAWTILRSNMQSVLGYTSVVILTALDMEYGAVYAALIYSHPHRRDLRRGRRARRGDVALGDVVSRPMILQFGT